MDDTQGQIAPIIEAISSLIQALGWPLLVLYILLYFGTPLKKLLSDASEFTFKAGATGLEASVKRQQIEAAAALGAANMKASSDPGAEQQAASNVNQASEIAAVVTQAVKPSSISRLSEATVLWVDDKPANNVYERKSMEALGIRFTLSLDTTDALDKLQLNRYDVIISDMGRGNDRRAGYTLLEEIKKRGNSTPLIFYSTNSSSSIKQESRQRGAFGQATTPQELFSLVLSAVQSGV